MKQLSTFGDSYGKPNCPYKVEFEWRDANILHEISAWCKENCTGHYFYQYTNTVFWFEKSEDAMLLKLSKQLTKQNQ